ncbi:HAD family hydrolase [Stackebrandtia nassauensis]|uniref:Haloacid dehalogenase domain protein hydrolase n=1 Tax=Stackebrandtia nassauensis (strain DSM 44728 / CIP 108903 / NRRL B-16338 / NBRC 102104 / LLR-40K-21) TaxID=446470 RepID=D3PXZ5_STANL|nr:HAD hydrolase-like protein [Stackebrandtia nassauensis]ADD45324.1 Haloacid dehalogenase domain protein hydrolase [Stackebrandtia nassauensis DSM 44728]
MAKHLVWDWNGTLIDDFAAVVEATNLAIGTVGGQQLDAATHRERFFRPVADFYSELAGRELPPAEFAELDKLFHQHYHSKLAEHGLTVDARAAIAAWPGTQSLLSMWFHNDLVPLVTEHGLVEHFARIDGLRETVGGNSKHPYLVAHLEALGIDATDCVLIGDSVDDHVAAATAGASCVLYAGGFTSPTRLRATGAPVAESLTEAVALALG